MKQAINSKIYDTDTAKLLAQKVPQVVHRLSQTEVRGTLVQLYVTTKQAYFKYEKPADDPVGNITPLTLEAAIKLYNGLPTRHVDFSEAFPDAGLEEA
jgi:hypothetical protein